MNFIGFNDDKTEHGIYFIIDKNNRIKYIGCSTYISKRLSKHRTDIVNNYILLENNEEYYVKRYSFKILSLESYEVYNYLSIILNCLVKYFEPYYYSNKYSDKNKIDLNSIHYMHITLKQNNKAEIYINYIY